VARLAGCRAGDGVTLDNDRPCAASAYEVSDRGADRARRRHLAGALGRPVWIALNRTPEWRWQRDREDCIWYPTARLFRQDRTGDWDGVFSRMVKTLAQLLEGRATSTAGAICNPTKWAPRVEVSWGELLDKITILEIKVERLSSGCSVENVRQELSHLKSSLARLGPLPQSVESKRVALRATNEKLWDVENAIRVCEAEQSFGERFVTLALNIYVLNDERSRIKQDINTCMKSSLVEEKEYQSYN